LLEADVLAPKFHFTDRTSLFERSFKDTHSEVPSVLQIVEEDYDADETITYYEDVIFLM
jgi:hypothetical protein